MCSAYMKSAITIGRHCRVVQRCLVRRDFIPLYRLPLECYLTRMPVTTYSRESSCAVAASSLICFVFHALVINAPDATSTWMLLSPADDTFELLVLTIHLCINNDNLKAEPLVNKSTNKPIRKSLINRGRVSMVRRYIPLAKKKPWQRERISVSTWELHEKRKRREKIDGDEAIGH